MSEVKIFRHTWVQDDLDPEDFDLISTKALERYIRQDAGIPASLDIEFIDQQWWTQGFSGEFYVDGPEIEIIVSR